MDSLLVYILVWICFVISGSLPSLVAACTEEGVIARLSAQEISSLVIDSFADDPSTSALLSAFLIPQIDYGVELRSICKASCQDYSDLSSACGSYGATTNHSGLLIIPLQDDGSSGNLSYLPGTRKLLVYGRGTRTDSQPSTDWQEQRSQSEILSQIVIVALTGGIAVVPDFMGFGSSNGLLTKGYVVRESYATSTLPLIYFTRQWIAEETSCRTTLSNSVIVQGYSEGGYAAIVIAQSLYDLNWDVQQVFAGGGPYKMGSIQLYASLREIDMGTYPEAQEFYLLLFGASFESFPFGDELALLKPEVEADIIQAVNTNTPGNELNSRFAGPTSILDVFDDSLVGFLRDAVMQGDSDPCRPESSVPNPPTLICEALAAQDLTATIQNAPFPIEFCHSSEDVLVAYENIPDFLENSNLSIKQITGTHQEAAAECLLSNIQYFLGVLFKQLGTSEAVIEGCTTEMPSPTGSPTGSPSVATRYLPYIPLFLGFAFIADVRA